MGKDDGISFDENGTFAGFTGVLSDGECELKKKEKRENGLYLEQTVWRGFV